MANGSRLAATYLAYRRRAETCSYPPTRVWVEAASHCNLQCAFCGNRLLSKDQRGFMDFDLFRRLADEASGVVPRFNLFHRGESLLHPRIGDMVRYAESKGIRTRINTNGMLLDRQMSRELIQSQLDILSFSFDGYDREMYQANRPGGDFDLVLTNIIGLLEEKKKTGARKPFVALEIMEITDCSAAELAKKRRDLLRRFRGLPLDKFIVRRPHNWGGLVDVPRSKPRGVFCRKIIPCPLLWHALVVFWDGRVLPCPQDFFGALEIGDLHSRTLMEIWNGDTLRSLRHEMRDPLRLKRHPCVDCDRILRSTVAGVPVDYLGRFLSENVFGNTWLSRILPH